MLPKFNVTGLVYIIRAEESRRVKIGYTSTEPVGRLNALQTGSPERLSLVATFPGSMDLERAIHAMLSGSRMHGEWFDDTEHVRLFVAGVCVSRPMTTEEMAAIPSPLGVTSAELEEIANEIVSRRAHDEAHSAIQADVCEGIDPLDIYDADYGTEPDWACAVDGGLS
jgi:hypothetical protein